MAKLYQKQGVQLPRKEIIQPEKQPSIAAAVANFGAQALDKIAKDNFVLGHANLVNDIITKAYEANPTDIKGFNEMVQAGIAKSTRNLPGDFARKIQLDTETKARALNAQIKNNFTKAQNAKFKSQIMVGVNDITDDGPMGLKSLNAALMDALINKNEGDTAATRALWDLQRQKLSNYADAKDTTGGYVIGKESERNMYKQGLYGKKDAFRGAIEGLSKDALIAFDEDVFQNKQKFMEAYGVDYATYDEMERWVKARRKAFDSQDKREIKSQDYFTLSQISAITDDQIADIESRGTVDQKTIDLIRDAKKAADKAGAKESAAFNFGDQNEGFLAAIMDMQEVVNSKDDGSPEYNEKLLQSAARADMVITKMFNAGLSEDATQMLRRGLTESVSSQDFAAVLDTSDTSFISELTRGAKHDFDSKMAEKEAAIRKKYGPNPNPIQERQMIEELRAIPSWQSEGSPVMSNRTPRTIEISDNTKKALRAYAAQIYNTAMIQAAQGDYEGAMKTRADGNRELIYMKYGQWIPRHRFAAMERDLQEGRRAFITLGGSQYEYMGISQNDIVMKGRF